MGTETRCNTVVILPSSFVIVKLNNPLMGTETDIMDLYEENSVYTLS